MLFSLKKCKKKKKAGEIFSDKWRMQQEFFFLPLGNGIRTYNYQYNKYRSSLNYLFN